MQQPLVSSWRWHKAAESRKRAILSNPGPAHGEGAQRCLVPVAKPSPHEGLFPVASWPCSQLGSHWSHQPELVSTFLIPSGATVPFVIPHPPPSIQQPSLDSDRRPELSACSIPGPAAPFLSITQWLVSAGLLFPIPQGTAWFLQLQPPGACFLLWHVHCAGFRFWLGFRLF